MRAGLGLFLLGLLLFGLPASSSAEDDVTADAALDYFTRLIDRVQEVTRRYLVQVTRTSEVPTGDPTKYQSKRVVGTGISMGNGYFLTLAGIVGAEAEVELRDPRGESHAARVVGLDRRTNLALLEAKDFQLPPVFMAREEILFPGALVVAVGLGPQEGPEASFGTVVLAEGFDVGYVESDMIQVTAPLYEGITGGALMNERGELVGVVAGRLDLMEAESLHPAGADQVAGYLDEERLITTGHDQGTLALPLDVARDIADELKETGYVRRGYLGLQVQLTGYTPGPEPSDRGVMVHRVAEGSPASRYGLFPGDVILEYAEAPVTTVENLSFLVAATRPGSSVPVQFLRRGVINNVHVRIEQAPELDWEPRMDAFYTLGTVTESTPPERR